MKRPKLKDFNPKGGFVNRMTLYSIALEKYCNHLESERDVLKEAAKDLIKVMKPIIRDNKLHGLTTGGTDNPLESPIIKLVQALKHPKP